MRVEAIIDGIGQVREMLLAKNAAYGDSAFAPLRMFSRADADEQILVRIDDKISRLLRGSAAGEDTKLDLIGYLVLLFACRLKRGRPELNSAAAIALVCSHQFERFAARNGSVYRGRSPIEVLSEGKRRAASFHAQDLLDFLLIERFG